MHFAVEMLRSQSGALDEQLNPIVFEHSWQIWKACWVGSGFCCLGGRCLVDSYIDLDCVLVLAPALDANPIV